VQQETWTSGEVIKARCWVLRDPDAPQGAPDLGDTEPPSSPARALPEALSRTQDWSTPNDPGVPGYAVGGDRDRP